MNGQGQAGERHAGAQPSPAQPASSSSNSSSSLPLGSHFFQQALQQQQQQQQPLPSPPPAHPSDTPAPSTSSYAAASPSYGVFGSAPLTPSPPSSAQAHWTHPHPPPPATAPPAAAAWPAPPPLASAVAQGGREENRQQQTDYRPSASQLAQQAAWAKQQQQQEQSQQPPPPRQAFLQPQPPVQPPPPSAASAAASSFATPSPPPAATYTSSSYPSQLSSALSPALFASGSFTPVPPVPSSHSSAPPAAATSHPASPHLSWVTDRCARVWSLLWHPRMKLRLRIPDSLLFCNGRYHSYLFTSKAHRGEVRKKTFATNTTNENGKGGSATSASHPPPTLSDLRRTLLSRTDSDPSNITPFVALLQAHDASQPECVRYHALPRVLRTMGQLAAHERVVQPSGAKGGESGEPQSADQVDLYQLVRAYVHPFGGQRFVTTYAFTPEEEATGGHSPPLLPHSIHTVASRYTDRYALLPEERAFYETSASLGGEEGRANGVGAPRSMPESVLRECERLTLCVVEWLARVHGVQVRSLSLEFVQNYSRHLVLHGVEAVELLPDPPEEDNPSLGLRLIRSIDSGREDDDEGEGGSSRRSTASFPTHSTSIDAGDSFSPSPSSTASSSAAQSQGGSLAPTRPASAAAGRTARAALALAASASSMSIPPSSTTPAAASPHAFAPSYSTATLSRSGYNTSTAAALGTHHPPPPLPPRPQSARAPASISSSSSSAVGAVSSRFSSLDLSSSFRNPQPPRGVVGVHPPPAPASFTRPSSARGKGKGGKRAAAANKNVLSFETMMKFETRVERDERMMAGGGGSALSPSSTSSAAGDSSAHGSRADYLLFHWRHLAREGQEEIVRLNSELEAATAAWQNREAQLLNLLQMEERKSAQQLQQSQSSQLEIDRLKQQLDESRLSSAHTISQQEGTIASLRQEAEATRLLLKRLEESNSRLSGELLLLDADKSKLREEVAAAQKQLSQANQQKEAAERELGLSAQVRDELLEKLEMEERFSRHLAQQLDLLSDWESFEEMRQLFQKAAGLAQSEGQRLKGMEGVRSQMIKYTKDRQWQEKKNQISKQAKAAKQQQLQGGRGANSGSVGQSSSYSYSSTSSSSGRDPSSLLSSESVPDRRITDILAERAIGRMRH